MTPPADRRAREWLALIHQAAKDFDFALPIAPTVDEAEALIRHVHQRDFARAFELLFGARQADWTPDQVKAFSAHMLALPHTDPDKASRPYADFPIVRVPFSRPPVDTAMLRRLVDRSLKHLTALRQDDPHAELPIMVSGLLTTGEVVAASASTEDRLPLVHLMARHEPLFGWLVAADLFIHRISLKGGVETAAKQDAIGVHFGTRETRGFLTVPYAVVDGVVRCEPEHEQDFAAETVTDPYAFVFTPPTHGAPS